MDPITDGLVLHHCVAWIGRIMKKKLTEKNEKVVALHGFGSSAAPIRFKFSSDLVDQRIIVTTDASSNDYFETFENISSFKSINSEK